MVTTMEAEIWTTAEGVAAKLLPVDFEPYDGDDEEFGGYEWFPEGPGQRPPQRYVLEAVETGEIIFDYTVFPYAPWSPYDAIFDVLMKEGFTPPPPTEAELALCEHGMSANGCSGPNHFGERVGEEW
jgi:hypothetical protein